MPPRKKDPSKAPAKEPKPKTSTVMISDTPSDPTSKVEVPKDRIAPDGFPFE